MRVLVTGAGGFVGRYLVANLTEFGHEVIAAARKPLDLECETVSFDIRQAVNVKQSIDATRPDAVIHLAAQPSVPASWVDPNLTYRVNILGSSNLLEALRDHSDVRVLLIGSAQAYGHNDLDSPLTEEHPLEPSSPYALSKVAQELLGRLYFSEFGRPVIMTRGFNHTGPGHGDGYAIGSFARQIAEIKLGRREPMMNVGNLESIRDYLDVRDVAEAYRLLIEKGSSGEAYNVCSGEGRSIGEILKILIDASGLDSQIQIEQDSTPRPSDPPMLVGDNTKIRSAVGWAPKIPLEQSLTDTLEERLERLSKE